MLERDRIRSWLEKRPESSDLPKVWDFDRADGSTLQISRVTQYFGQDWKVRIAFIVETNYPILMSTPIQAQQDGKGKKPAKKVVPKDYAKMAKAGSIPTVDLDELLAGINKEIHTPNVLLVPEKPWAWDDDQTHMDVHLEALKAMTCPSCGEPGCHCYEGGL